MANSVIFVLLGFSFAFFATDANGASLEVKIINETGKDLGIGQIRIYGKNALASKGCKLPNENAVPVMNKTYVPNENLTTRIYDCDSVNVKKWQRNIEISGLCNFRNLIYLDDAFSVKYPRKKKWYGREQFKDTGRGVMYTVRVRASDCPSGSLD